MKNTNNVPRHMIDQPHYKPGTIITDGENFIRIGYVFEPSWTPNNNYGNKDYAYWDCSCVINEKSKVYDKHSYLFIRIQNEKEKSTKKFDSIPNLWIQDLKNWVIIKENMISKKIKNKLLNGTK